MKWIGLTGGIASGKSTVSQILRDLGYEVVDADEIAKQVVQPGTPGLQSVISQFGTQILDAHGSLDRKKLGAIVFGNPEKLLILENILHPLVQNITSQKKDQLEMAGIPMAFYDVPLLFEKKLEKNFDDIVVITTSPENQRERMKQRDQLDELEISKRLQSQVPLSEKIQKARWIIENNGSIEDLGRQVRDLALHLQGLR
ncbi:MAG: dephospho-CoA kinase [Bdellovibrio sp. CG10_big_fil_rev_8_21_14_0_10_47_8]|nr:MAG: dephospho-CoA kinase [Bdellovibrio sp. CG10_big_fil_rev_8_21_14_0_10_47_8]